MPIDNKPVMLDDTCYFIAFDLPETAIFVWIIIKIHYKEIKQFLETICFLDSKRPFTKEKLMRVNLIKIIQITTYKQFQSFIEKFGADKEADIINLIKTLKINNSKQFDIFKNNLILS